MSVENQQNLDQIDQLKDKEYERNPEFEEKKGPDLVKKIEGSENKKTLEPNYNDKIEVSQKYEWTKVNSMGSFDEAKNRINKIVTDNGGIPESEIQSAKNSISKKHPNALAKNPNLAKTLANSEYKNKLLISEVETKFKEISSNMNTIKQLMEDPTYKGFTQKEKEDYVSLKEDYEAIKSFKNQELIGINDFEVGKNVIQTPSGFDEVKLNLKYKGISPEKRPLFSEKVNAFISDMNKFEGDVKKHNNGVEFKNNYNSTVELAKNGIDFSLDPASDKNTAWKDKLEAFGRITDAESLQNLKTKLQAVDPSLNNKQKNERYLTQLSLELRKTKKTRNDIEGETIKLIAERAGSKDTERKATK